MKYDASYAAAQRLKEKRRANAKIPSQQNQPSRQQRRREAISNSKEIRSHLKANAMKHKDPGGSAAVGAHDVSEYLLARSK